MSAVNSNPKTPLYSDFMAFHLPVYAYSDGMNVNDDGETTITTSPLAANSSDTVQLIVGKAQQIFPVSIEVLSTTAGSAPKMVLISGASGDKLQTVKDWLVKNCDRQTMWSVKANGLLLLDEHMQYKAIVRETMDAVTESLGIKVTIKTVHNSPLKFPLMSVDGTGDVLVEVQGGYGAVQSAKLKILSLLDQLAGLTVEKLDGQAADRTKVPIIAGRRQINFSRLSDQFEVNIYHCGPFILSEGVDQADSTVVISGKPDNVIAAKKELLNIAKRKLNSLKSKDIRIDSEKFLFLLSSAKQRLAKLMQDCGFQIKSSQARSEIRGEMFLTLQAESDAILEYALKRFTDLLMEVGSLCVPFSAGALNSAFVQTFMRQAANYKVHTSFISNYLTVVGKHKDLLAFARTLGGSKILLSVPGAKSRKFMIDMAAEYEEFITGKKSGKINKIVKSCGCNIELTNPTAERLRVEVSCNIMDGAVEGYAQLMDELPAELEFFVQDTHHKRIIGVGGKNIQGIMKEYGVYVKFLSNDEFKMIGGLNEFDQNVIARTPAKNSENLKNLHRSVLGVVDGDTEMEGKKIVWLELPRRQHGRLRNYCRSVLESELSGTVKFIFPLSSAASERVRLEGDAETIDAAVKRLRTYIVQSVALYAPLMTSSQQLQTVQESKQFKAIQQQIKSPPLNLQLSIAPQVDDYSVIKISGDWESVERYSAKISGDLQKLLASCGVNIPDQSRLPFANNTVQIAIINGQDQHPDGTNSSTDLTTEELGRMSNKLRTSRLSGSAPNLTLNTANLLYADGSTPQQQQQQRQQQQSASGRKTPLPIGSFKQLNISVGGDSNTSNSDDHEGSINNGSLKSAVDQITTGGRQTPFLIRNDEQTVHQQRSLKSPAGILDPISTHTRRFTDGIPLSGSRSELASPFGQIKGAASFIGNGPTPPPITAAPVGRTNTGNTSKAEDYASDNEDYDRRNIVSAIGSVMNSVQAADSNWRENNRLNLLLDQLDLAKYKQTFSSNDVDFEMFLTLTEQDFKELGVSLGARRRMNLAIGEIRQQRQSTQQPMQPAILRIQTNGGALPLAYTSLTSAPALVAAQSPTGQTKQQMWGKSGGRNNAPVSAYPDLQQQRFYPNNQPLSAFAAPSNPYALVSPINVTGNKQFFVQQPYPQQQPQQVDGKDPNGVYHTVVAESQKSPPNIS